MSAGSARVEPVAVATVLPSAYEARLKKSAGGNRDTTDATAKHDACDHEVKLPQRAGGLRKQLKEDYRPGAINLNCYHFIENDERLAYDLAAEEKIYRNRLSAILLKQADDICTSEKALLIKHQAEMNSITSVLTSALAGASTVVSGELAQKILSASAGLSNSTRDHLNTHIYRNQIIQTITKAIDSERRTIADQIATHESQRPQDYSVDAMIRDVNRYHQVCSIGHGLQVVMEAVEKREDYIKDQKVEAILQQVRSIQYDPLLKGAGVNSSDARKLILEAVKLRTGVNLDVTSTDIPNDQTPNVDEPKQEIPDEQPAL